MKPDVHMVARLAKNSCTDGVGVTFREGSCTIAINRSGS